MRLILLLFLSFSLLVAEVAKISAVVGDATIVRDGKNIVVTLGAKLEKKDTIYTKRNSKLQIIFNDNTVVTLGKNSALNVKEYVYDPNTPKNSKTNLNFFKGAFKTITGNIGKINKEKFKLSTKTATIGIRGTTILGNQNVIACTRGEIEVTSQGQTVVVPQNNLTFTKEGNAPSSSQKITSNNLNELEEEIEPDTKSEDSTEDSEDNNESSSTNSESNSDESSGQNDEATDGDSSLSGTDEDNNTTNQETTVSSESTTKTAQEASEDSTDTDDSKKTVTEYSQKGYFLGANSSFYQYDNSFDAKRSNNVYSYDDTLSKEKINSSSTGFDSSTVQVDNSKQFSSFDEPGVGKYSGIPTTALSKTMSYSYSDPTVSSTYTIYADNVGEVFVGISDGASFDEMFVTGTTGNMANLDSSKVYVYKEFASMTVKKDTDSINTISIKDNSGFSNKSYIYYNPKYNSLTNYNTKLIPTVSNLGSQDNLEFVAGDKTSVNSYYNKFTLNSTDSWKVKTYEHHDTNTITDGLSFLGTDLQALARSVNVDSKVYDIVGGTATINETNNSIGVAFLDKDAMFSSNTFTNTYKLEGFTSSLIIDKANKPVLTNETDLGNFYLNISEDASNANNIKAVGKLRQGSSGSYLIDLNFDAEVLEKDMYYINQDMFGAMAESGSHSSGSNNIKDNTTYFISIHDDNLLSTDNPSFLEDDSSWGYWTASFDNDVYVDPRSLWVSGIINTSVINNVLTDTSGANTTYTFLGNVLGSVVKSTGEVENILVHSTLNKAELVFSLGNSNNSLTSGTIKFLTSGDITWNLSVNSTVVNVANNGKYNSTLTGSGTGNITGQFYGQTKIESTGGVFNATNSSNDIASGIFKAKVQ